MTDQALSKEQFAKWVRDAYNRLYDSPYLHHHPLVAVLLPPEAQTTHNRSQNLRRVLLAAIEALKPQSGAPTQSPDWRTYRIFDLRYIEGLSSTEAMEQLAVSKSQFFRDQAQGFDHVIALLWEQRNVTAPVPGWPSSWPASEHETVQTETDRLFALATWENINLFDILTELHPVIETLSQIRRVQIEYGALKSLAPVRADRVILRQALLNLITHTVTHTSEKHIHLAQHRGARETGLTVRFKLAPSSAAPPSVESEWQLCDQLVSIVNGRFSIRDKDGVRHITLAWPAAPQRTVLIVDDNQGLLDLYRRYLAGQNWQVMGARNGAEARQLLLDTQPTVILLDVMMPGEDGWELLVSLKSAHELTDIPVIICSVVNQPQLAAGLGAAGYLTKPLTQQTLLQALAPWS